VGVDDRLRSLKLDLPVLHTYEGAFVPGVKVGNLVFLSAQGWNKDNQPLLLGRVGAEVSVDQAREAARQCVLSCLAAAKLLLGSLDQVERIVKLNGFVRSAPGFGEQAKVVNAASDLLVEIFGERGRHSRTSLGVAELTGGNAFLLDLVLQAATV
jgi:enamine deaminase RidA (YjgF/YER057c/UK114 family)